MRSLQNKLTIHFLSKQYKESCKLLQDLSHEILPNFMITTMQKALWAFISDLNNYSYLGIIKSNADYNNSRGYK